MISKIPYHRILNFISSAELCLALEVVLSTISNLLVVIVVCFYAFSSPGSDLDSITRKYWWKVKMSAPMNKYIHFERLVIGELTNHNLIWAHVKHTCAISYKLVNFQPMGPVKMNSSCKQEELSIELFIY